MSDSNLPHVSLAVIGVSAGGLAALKTLLGPLPVDFSLPILVVQHIAPDADSTLADLLNMVTALRVKEAEECEAVLPGTVYLAPPNYHLLLERDGTLSLSADPPVSFARPSIDVLFEAAAEAYGREVVGVILTGANADGSAGLACIKRCGGLAVVQDPEEAEVASMPQAALLAASVDYVLPLSGIVDLLLRLEAVVKRERI